ncbi:hypothetical protein [Nocardia cyriacigeorgica]|uniref:hypothetical protein n=1 Tax=Nocardia cyriacigeorgica TaxID=135487 RepID=UPI0020D15B5F|nr:hypothetical protein [Nocardia cyriacigeorgica]
MAQPDIKSFSFFGRDTARQRLSQVAVVSESLRDPLADSAEGAVSDRAVPGLGIHRPPLRLGEFQCVPDRFPLAQECRCHPEQFGEFGLRLFGFASLDFAIETGLPFRVGLVVRHRVASARCQVGEAQPQHVQVRIHQARPRVVGFEQFHGARLQEIRGDEQFVQVVESIDLNERLLVIALGELPAQVIDGLAPLLRTDVLVLREGHLEPLGEVVAELFEFPDDFGEGEGRRSRVVLGLAQYPFDPGYHVLEPGNPVQSRIVGFEGSDSALDLGEFGTWKVVLQVPRSIAVPFDELCGEPFDRPLVFKRIAVVDGHQTDILNNSEIRALVPIPRSNEEVTEPVPPSVWGVTVGTRAETSDRVVDDRRHVLGEEKEIAPHHIGRVHTDST